MFHAIVCIKQVPDTTDVKINPETNTLMREGSRAIINPFDTYAIEEALRWKEKHGGKVTVIYHGAAASERGAARGGGDGLRRGRSSSAIAPLPAPTPGPPPTRCRRPSASSATMT